MALAVALQPRQLPAHFEVIIASLIKAGGSSQAMYCYWILKQDTEVLQEGQNRCHVCACRAMLTALAPHEETVKHG